MAKMRTFRTRKEANAYARKRRKKGKNVGIAKSHGKKKGFLYDVFS